MLHSIISQQWENAAGRELFALSDGRDAAGRWWLSYRLKRCSIQLRGTIYGFRRSTWISWLPTTPDHHRIPFRLTFQLCPLTVLLTVLSCSGLTQSNVAAPRKP